MFLESIPKELFEMIMEQLDSRNIVKCMRVSRKLRDKIKDSTRTLYRIELEVEGYIDYPKYQARSYEERLALLEEKARFWKELEWKESISYGSGTKSGVRMIRHGVIVYPFSPDKEEPNLDHYEVVQLKVRVGAEEAPKRFFTVPSNYKLLAFDPGQDLLIAATKTDNISSLHFLHFGTSRPHPESVKSEFVLTEKITPSHVQIFRNLVALTHLTTVAGPPSLVGTTDIFDWRKGLEVIKINVGLLSSSFTLLSEDRYVHIASIKSHNTYALQLRSLRDNGLIATFLLPEPNPRWNGSMGNCLVSSTSYLTSDSFTPLQLPFSIPPDPKLILLYINYACPELQCTSSFNFVIQTKCLYPDPEFLSKWTDKIVPWTAWGEENSRVFKGKMDHHVVAYRVSTDEFIFDFNQLSIERDLCRGRKAGVYKRPTIISDEVFKEIFTSKLPYRRVPHRISHPGSQRFSRFRRNIEDPLLRIDEFGNIETFI